MRSTPRRRSESSQLCRAYCALLSMLRRYSPALRTMPNLVAIFGRFLASRRPRVKIATKFGIVLAGLAYDAELGGDLHARPARGQEAADQLLVVVRPVDIGRVQEIDAGLHGVVQRLQRQGVVARTIELAHAHAAQAQEIGRASCRERV